MAIKLKITQVKSGVGRSKHAEPHARRASACAVRTRRWSSRTRVAIRGMIRKVSHLVTVESAD